MLGGYSGAFEHDREGLCIDHATNDRSGHRPVTAGINMAFSPALQIRSWNYSTQTAGQNDAFNPFWRSESDVSSVFLGSLSRETVTRFHLL